MNKKLLTLAIPMVLLASCNNDVPKPSGMSFKEFQSLIRRNITNGIYKEGTFYIMKDYFDIDPETGNLVKNYDKSLSCNYIRNLPEMYYTRGSSTQQFILNYDENKTYAKNGGSWYDYETSPNLMDGDALFNETVNRAMNELSNNKNGKFSDNGRTLIYHYKNTLVYSGEVKYRVDLKEDLETIDNFRIMFYSSESGYLDYTITITSFTGEIPVHTVE